MKAGDYPHIMAAQRNNSIAPQMAMSTSTIFQCFFEKRFVGIILIPVRFVGVYQISIGNASHALCTKILACDDVSKPVKFKRQNQHHARC